MRCLQNIDVLHMPFYLWAVSCTLESTFSNTGRKQHHNRRSSANPVHQHLVFERTKPKDNFLTELAFQSISCSYKNLMKKNKKEQRIFWNFVSLL